MRRRMPCEAGLYPALFALTGTVNRDPAWGHPAGSLFVLRADWLRAADGTGVAEIALSAPPLFHVLHGSHRAADWSAIEASAEVNPNEGE